jgi:FG-GAP-like repeat
MKLRLRFAFTMLALTLVWSVVAGPTNRDRSPSFQQTSIPTAKGPRFIVVTDVNHDGKPDLVVANEESGSITVLLGDGKGGFVESKGSPFSAGHLPNDIAVADMNHDGHLDLIIANHQSPYVTILLGDGKGGFRPAPNSPFDVHSNPHPHGVVVGAFCDGGELGVVTDSWGNNQIELLEGDGKGGLRTPGRFFHVGRRPYERLRSADFNRDGHPDVVTTDLDDNTVTVLLGDGKGGLREAKNSPIPAGAKPWQVAIDDLDGDGKADLAIIPYERDLPDPDLNVVTILLGDGQGGFTPSPSSALSLEGCHGPNSIATGDIAGDGHRDIAVACAESKNVAIFMNRGGEKYERFIIASAGGWGAVALADLNGDGKADLITANHDNENITVYLSK